MMTRSDLLKVTLLGLAVGLLVQPIIANTMVDIQKRVAVEAMVLQLGALLFFVVLAPVALSVANFIARWVPIVFQIAKFAAVGSLNSFIDLGVLNLLIFLTGTNKGWGYTAFTLVSFLAATTNSFIWNKFWTFGSKGGNVAAQAAGFYLATALVGGMNVAIASGVTNFIPPLAGVSQNLWATVGKLCGIFAGMTFNFLIYKFIIFKPSQPAPVGEIRS